MNYESFHDLLNLLCRLGVVEFWNAEGLKVTGVQIKGIEHGEIDKSVWDY